MVLCHAEHSEASRKELGEILPDVRMTWYEDKRSFRILKSIATIGSFDGVHRGHQCLLKQVRRIADERGLRSMAVTFGCSPKRVLGMADVPQLSTIEERTTLLRQSGMDEVAVLDFTPQMAAMTARDFMQQSILRYQNRLWRRGKMTMPIWDGSSSMANH